MTFLLILAVAPGAFIVYYVYKQDKIEKEPRSLIRKLLLAGAISVIPAVILEIVSEMILNVIASPGTYFYIMLEAFLGVALIEEMGKYFVLKKYTWRNPEEGCRKIPRC